MAGSGRLTTQFERGVTSARPQVNTPFVDIAQGLRPIGQMVGGMIDDAREREMVKSGTAEGRAAANTQIAGGQPDMHFSLLDEVFAPARVDAAQKAYVATIKTDIDSQEEALRTKFALDPEGYKTATQRMVSGFIQGSPHDMAIDVAAYARGRVSDGLGGITKARVEKDTQESIQAVNAREAMAKSRQLALAGDAYGTKQYEDAAAETRALRIFKRDSPLFNYTQEQMDLEDAALDFDVKKEVLKTHIQAAYKAEGALGAKRLVAQVLGYEDPEVEAAYAPKGSVVYTPPLDLPVGSAYGADRPKGPHNGDDIPAPIGTPVKTIAGGTVKVVSENARSGKFIRILHDDGRISAYGHLSAQDVKEGDRIEAGAIIGKVGNTGDSEGPHLHIVVRDRDGNTVNPQSVYGTEAAPTLAGAAPVEQGPPVPAFGPLPPGQQKALGREAAAFIKELNTVDLEETRQAEAARAAAAREDREAYGSYSLGITNKNRDDPWNKDPNLSDGTKARLNKELKAAIAADQAQVRRDETAESAAQSAAYQVWRDRAEEGNLTDEDLATAINGGQITRFAAEALRGVRQKALKSGIDEMQGANTAFFESRPLTVLDNGKWNGMKARFDAEAIKWLSQGDNRDATPEQKAAAGQAILDRIHPTKKDTKLTPSQQAAAGIKEKRRKEALRLKQQGKITEAEYQKRLRDNKA